MAGRAYRATSARPGRADRPDPETGPNTARVLLITDPESIVPVRRTRDGLPALAAGRGDGLIDVRSVMPVQCRIRGRRRVRHIRHRWHLFAQYPGRAYRTPVARYALARSFAPILTRSISRWCSRVSCRSSRARTARHRQCPHQCRRARHAMRAPVRIPFDPHRRPCCARSWLRRIGDARLADHACCPMVASLPFLPPSACCAARLAADARRFAFAIWAAGAAGIFRRPGFGQPLGGDAAVDDLRFRHRRARPRLVWRDFWQDWLIAAGAIGFCLIAGRLIAAPIRRACRHRAADADDHLGMLFPLVSRFCAWLDRKRESA
jgi:rod shape-determining protein MreD